MLKIGGGTPPILTRHGWLIVYHGVSEVPEPSNDGHHLCYSAGVMVLSKEHPRMNLHRSEEPVLTPQMPQERRGLFPTSCSPPALTGGHLGSPDRIDVYYGMADKRIGVARLGVPEHLRPGARRRRRWTKDLGARMKDKETRFRTLLGFALGVSLGMWRLIAMTKNKRNDVK